MCIMGVKISILLCKRLGSFRSVDSYSNREYGTNEGPKPSKPGSVALCEILYMGLRSFWYISALFRLVVWTFFRQLRVSGFAGILRFL